MKLATTTGNFYSYTHSQTESLKYIREAGFSYADYNFGSDFKSRSGVYGADYKSYFEEIKHAVDKIGIRLVQAHSPMGQPFGEESEKFIEDTIRCVDACGYWGIPNLVVHSGYANGLSVEETFLKNKEFFSPILLQAEKYGVNILVENFNKRCEGGIFWIDKATELLELIEYIDHPLFHAVWDAGHANLQEMPQDKELEILGSHVLALHIHDNFGDKDTHLLPFLGTMNMDAVMNGLKRIGYNGYFTFEVGGIFTPPAKKRPYPEDTRLLDTPIEWMRTMTAFLYETGKHILKSYDCFEE